MWGSQIVNVTCLEVGWRLDTFDKLREREGSAQNNTLTVNGIGCNPSQTRMTTTAFMDGPSGVPSVVYSVMKGASGWGEESQTHGMETRLRVMSRFPPRSRKTGFVCQRHDGPQPQDNQCFNVCVTTAHDQSAQRLLS